MTKVSHSIPEQHHIQYFIHSSLNSGIKGLQRLEYEQKNESEYRRSLLLNLRFSINVHGITTFIFDIPTVFLRKQEEILLLVHTLQKALGSSRTNNDLISLV